MGARPDAVVPTFARTGNMAAATLPLQLALATEQGRLHPGMKIALFGLAGGGIMLIDWTAPRTSTLWAVHQAATHGPCRRTSLPDPAQPGLRDPASVTGTRPDRSEDSPSARRHTNAWLTRVIMIRHDLYELFTGDAIRARGVMIAEGACARAVVRRAAGGGVGPSTATGGCAWVTRSVESSVPRSVWRSVRCR
ncbi:3-oxoacyl-[acyl-carrier-protein] synthase III C-terminal domain-containing protein [Embleya sp. NPDC001921]